MTERVVHILPEQVASQIAAGEVVERPASALKELIENALDAGARSINVEGERGGCGLIAVTDDGCGMIREDAILSLRRHATSKIRDASDLGAISTFGFRGEALASIASVSRLTLRSRRANDDSGIELSVNGGEIESAGECAMAAGTRIEVRDLFFNTPARLKFLKSVATEQGAMVEAVQRLALANREVAFSLTVDGRKLFDLPRASSLMERMRQLYGAKMAARMLAFEAGENGMRAWGLLSMSQESFPSARMIFTFVNRRAVRDRMLMRAVAMAYQTLIPRGRYPAVAMFLDLRPEEVDVNVHPMKTEVRFRRSGGVFELAYHALRARLADQVSLDEPSVAEARAAMPPPAPLPAASAAANNGMRASANPAAVPVSVGEQAERPLRLLPDRPADWRAEQRALKLGFGGARTGEPTQPSGATPGADNAPGLAQPGLTPVPLYSQLKVLGQIFAGYIALEDDEGMLLVDQHAAHERVTFERLRGEVREGGVRVQAMLTPVTVELNPARAGQVIAALPEFRAMGFDLEQFGPTTLLLKGAPAVFGVDNALRLLTDMIDSMGDDGFGLRRDSAFEDLLKQLACHGSVRVGRTLNSTEISQLLSDLDRTEFKTNCPHGRPVHIRFARGQIERMFRR